MKKSELKQIIREEIQLVLTESAEFNKLKNQLSSKEVNIIKDIVADKKDLADYSDLYDKLFQYWSGKMPRWVWKSDPYDWIHQKLISIIDKRWGK